MRKPLLAASAAALALALLTPTLAGADTSPTAAPSLNAPLAKAAADMPVVVRPLKPDALDAPADLGRAVDRLADDLGKQSDVLAARQKDIAACYAAATAEPRAADGTYYACLASAAGATVAAWGDVEKLFAQFGDELTKVEQRLGEIKKAEGDDLRQREADATRLKASLGAALTKLRQIAPQVKSGALSPDDELKVRQLIDDARAARLRIAIADGGRAARTRDLATIEAYDARIVEARNVARFVAYQSHNRSDTWAAVLDDVKARAPLAVLVGGFSAESLAALAPALEKLNGLGDFQPPADPNDGQPAAAPPTILSHGSLADELDKLLNDNAPAVGAK